MKSWLWVRWHQLRRHRAYWLRSGVGACNTCDKDAPPHSRIGRWWS